MTERSFFNEVYGSWKDKQVEKYEEMVSEIGKWINGCEKALDIGIGKAWFWEYLKEKNYDFGFVRGLDVSKKAIEPEKSYIDYVFIDKDEKNLDLEEYIGKDKYDLILALDSIHLINYSDKLPFFLKKGGFILQSVPLKFKDCLKKYPDMEIIKEGKAGSKEIDKYILQKK
ncbi:MAG: class I SAM-dependent methyltransferase [archaeon]